jgi:serine/threonine protein kinase
MAPGPGSRFDAYEIVRPLGSGGMGEVWLATEVRLGRKVALKVLPADLTRDPLRVKRFEQEARAASALNHPTSAPFTRWIKTSPSAGCSLSLPCSPLLLAAVLWT